MHNITKLRNGNAQFAVCVILVERMQTIFTHNNLTWIDLESPSHSEIAHLVEKYGISGHIAEELLLPSGKPRAEFYENYLYTIMHFPALRHSHKSREQEVDFIVGKDFIITAHHDTIDPLHKFSKVFEVNSLLETSTIGDHAGYIFFYMLKKLYKAAEHEVEYVRHDLAVIEEHIFSEEEVEMVSAISRSARDLLNMRQTLEPHREVLREIEDNGGKFFGESFVPYLRGLSNEYYRLHNHIMRETESLHELRETNNSLLTTKQNETMKVFTILAFVTFPLDLICSIFSMDTQHTPIIGLPYDFWIIMGILVIFGFFMFRYFRHKKWL